MPDLGTLTFQWPMMLWLLVAVPLMALLYLALLARRRRTAARYASLVAAAQSGGGVLRHLPPAILLLGLAAMLFAVSRPQSVIMLPSRINTVMLAIDVSGSMRASDVEPNRLAAAQAVAKTFIDEQPGHVRVGVVAIAGTAAVVQSPTDNREDLAQAIDRFQLQRGSALGSGLIIALTTLLPRAGIDAEQLISGISSKPGAEALRKEPPKPPGAEAAKPAGGGAAKPAGGGAAKPAGGEAAKPAAPGSDPTVAVVLLSDGQSNTGPDPLKMAQIAAEHGVRVFTVGVGTPAGAVLTAKGWSMRVRLDEDTLKKIASVTGAEYFRAANAAELKKIYKSLGTRMVLEKHQSVEVTGLFAALGAALALLGATLSMLWFSRIL